MCDCCFTDWGFLRFSQLASCLLMVFLCKEKNVDVNLMVEIFIFIFFPPLKMIIFDHFIF